VSQPQEPNVPDPMRSAINAPSRHCRGNRGRGKLRKLQEIAGPACRPGADADDPSVIATAAGSGAGTRRPSGTNDGPHAPRAPPQASGEASLGPANPGRYQVVRPARPRREGPLPRV
jgi:hypothetical protein